MTTKKNNYLIPFIFVTSLFFLWGIANNLNGILIPHLRKALQLSNMQSTFVDTAVYLAYFLSAIPAGMILNKFGYKKGIIAGLLVFSVGAFLFIPAANTRTYEVFLLGLFIIGIGLTILETAANPYATKLGDEESATTRLNLAQSFNGLAAFVAPLIGSLNLLYLSLAGTGLSFYFNYTISRKWMNDSPVVVQKKNSTIKNNPENTTGESSYLRSIYFLALFSLLGYYFVDNMFQRQARAQFPNPEDLSIFFGQFLVPSI